MYSTRRAEHRAEKPEVRVTCRRLLPAGEQIFFTTSSQIQAKMDPVGSLEFAFLARHQVKDAIDVAVNGTINAILPVQPNASVVPWPTATDCAVGLSNTAGDLHHQADKKDHRQITIEGARIQKEAWAKVGGCSLHMESVLRYLAKENVVELTFFDSGDKLIGCCTRSQGIGNIFEIKVLDEQRFADHMFASDSKGIPTSIMPYSCVSENPHKTVVAVFSKQGFACMQLDGSRKERDAFPNLFRWSQEQLDKNAQRKAKRGRKEIPDEQSGACKHAAAKRHKKRPAAVTPLDMAGGESDKPSLEEEEERRFAAGAAVNGPSLPTSPLPPPPSLLDADFASLAEALMWRAPKAACF
jgi:hypothetical protein